MTATYTIMLALSAFLFAYICTALLVRFLGWASVVDIPNERSNHTAPTPRGGGLGVIVPTVGFMIVSGAHGGIMCGALLLMAVSFMDDKMSLSVGLRLAIQALVIAWALTYFGNYGLVFQGMFPLWLDRLAAGILWLWFINLYNFMDGIDEITSVQTGAISVGLIALTITEPGIKNFLAVDGAIVGGAIVAFWLFNRHPAKIFLGDAGSVPLGFLVGFLLLVLAAEGYAHAALILPAYYLCDATLTLLGRLMGGENISLAHTKHAYQRAVRGGRSHDDVARHILALNMVLITLAVVSVLGGVYAQAALVAAYVLSLGLMLYFRKHTAPRPVAAHA